MLKVLIDCRLPSGICTIILLPDKKHYHALKKILDSYVVVR